MALCEKKETVKYKCFFYSPTYPHNTKCVAKEIEKMADTLEMEPNKLAMYIDRGEIDTDEDKQYADPVILISISSYTTLIKPGMWIVKTEGKKSSYPYYHVYSIHEFNDKFNVVQEVT